MLNLLTANVPLIVDVVVIVALALSGLLGFKRGFVKTFLKIFGSFLAFLLTVSLASKVTLGMENKFGLVSWVGGGLEDVLTRIFGDTVMNTSLETASRDFLASEGVGNWLIDIILNSQKDGSIPLDTTLNQIICPSFAYYIAMIIVGILLYIIFKIIFFLIGNLFKSLHRIKLVKLTDGLLGLALGLLSGFIAIEIAIMIIGIIPVPFFTEIHVAATGSGFTGFIHKINIFSLILNSIAKGDVITVIKDVITSVG